METLLIIQELLLLILVQDGPGMLNAALEFLELRKS